MGLAERIIQVVDSKILGRFAPPDRTVYYRTITRTGSFEIIGRSVAVSYSDELLSVQPMFRRITRNDALISQDNLVLPDDFAFVLSVNSITKQQLISKDHVLVLVDGGGNEEVLRPISYINPSINITEVAYIGIYRSINRL